MELKSVEAAGLSGKATCRPEAVHPVILGRCILVLTSTLRLLQIARIRKAAMSHASVMRWQEASKIAIASLGKDTCDDDPLAYWCLVELIFNYGNRRA